MRSPTIILLFFFLIVFNNTYSQNPLKTKDHLKQQFWVDSIYNSFSSDQKIGQLFTIWVATKDGESRMNEIASLIEKNHLGGLIFSLGKISSEISVTVLDILIKFSLVKGA